jgi:SAM-dependent methyltransferase
VNNACIICGHAPIKDLYCVPGFTNPARLFQLHRCESCGHVSADVTANDLVSAYEANYYRTAYPDYERDAAIHQRNFDDLLRRIELQTTPGSLIEIGSAFGFLLMAAKARGWAVRGYDTSVYASGIARERYGVDVCAKDFLHADIHDNFDLAVMLDTVEHLIDPVAVILKTARILRSKGLIYLTTGDRASAFARICGRHWRMIAPPLHVHYFTPASISRLLGKAGLCVVDISHPAKYHDLSSVVRHFSGGRLVLPFSLPLPVNLGDTMAVLAKKDL